MNFDFERHLGAVLRTVAAVEVEGKPARAVSLARSYETSAADLWDALTNAQRLSRWFLPVSGDLKLNGRYQLQGNAEGTITRCEPPTRLALTWEFGGEISWLEVVLKSEEPERTRLKLTHTAPVTDHWTQYGPGAVGVGWELGLVGLEFYIQQPQAPKLDEAELAASEEGKAFTLGSCGFWGKAAVAAGENAETAQAAARRTAAFYTGTPGEQS